jgi:hypothetical protein
MSTSVYFRDPDDNLVEFTVYDRSRIESSSRPAATQ